MGDLVSTGDGERLRRLFFQGDESEQFAKKRCFNVVEIDSSELKREHQCRVFPRVYTSETVSTTRNNTSGTVSLHGLVTAPAATIIVVIFLVLFPSASCELYGEKSRKEFFLSKSTGQLLTRNDDTSSSYLSWLRYAHHIKLPRGGGGGMEKCPPFAHGYDSDDLSAQHVEVEPPYSISTPGAPNLQYAHGTTTVSFIFKNGIVVAVDSRASIGSFVGSKTTQKVLPITRRILGTMAGGAADCSFWIRRLRSEAKLLELSRGDDEDGTGGITVARASRMLANALYENRELNLSIGTMIMGYDSRGGGEPSIYYVNDSGARIKGDMFAVGSGSTFALGILDTERRVDMNEEEAIALAIRAIRHATFRDAYSGGYIGVYVITKDGWRKVFSEDLALQSEELTESADKF